jgi:hypothetical protein
MTGYIYNGFGKYEDRKKEKGITLKYAGIEFFLPYGKVTPIPDFHFREVDHAATSEAWEQGDDGALIYRTLRVPGERIVEEFTEAQNVGGAEPVKNKDRGIIAIRGTLKNQIDKVVKAPAGSDENGTPLFEEVRLVAATPEEISLAETLALQFKKLIIEMYFDSKRERMSGGQGRIRATGLEKVFMEELNVADIDQVNIRTQPPAPAPTAPSPELMHDFLAFLTNALKAGQTPEKAVALSSEATKKLASDKKAQEALT